VHESYAGSDFIRDYHAFKGNAYGLANTLKQTAIFRPRIKSKKVSNLYFTGQLTVPGPGVPPAIISGQVVADYIQKHFSKN
jgi:phytoene desaturase